MKYVSGPSFPDPDDAVAKSRIEFPDQGAGPFGRRSVEDDLRHAGQPDVTGSRQIAPHQLQPRAVAVESKPDPSQELRGVGVELGRERRRRKTAEAVIVAGVLGMRRVGMMRPDARHRSLEIERNRQLEFASILKLYRCNSRPHLMGVNNRHSGPQQAH